MAPMIRNVPTDVSISGGGVQWDKQFTEEDGAARTAYRQFSHFVGGCAVISAQRALLYPVRTNSLKSFAKDFFLPTVMNHTICDLKKIKSTIEKVIKIIKDFFLDVITLPIRVLTCIPRMVINSNKEETPLLVYLKQQDGEEAQKLAKLDVVYVICKGCLYWDDPVTRKWYYYNFIEVPG